MTCSSDAGVQHCLKTSRLTVRPAAFNASVIDADGDCDSSSDRLFLRGQTIRCVLTAECTLYSAGPVRSLHRLSASSMLNGQFDNEASLRMSYCDAQVEVSQEK